jgi:hypothetical protein
VVSECTSRDLSTPDKTFLAIYDLKRDNIHALVAVLVLVVAVSVFAVVVSYSLQSTPEVYGPKKPFHVGVTYCGSSVDEAKQLVDRVKNYTNLFVVQSYYLQTHVDELNQVCDYAVTNGLDIIVYFGAYHSQENAVSSFLGPAESRWGSHFLGLYYNDEPGGKMLDSNIELGNITKKEYEVTKRHIYNDSYSEEIAYRPSGEVFFSTSLSQPYGHSSFTTTNRVYQLNGTINYEKYTNTFDGTTFSNTEIYLTYYPDGTVQDQNGTYVTDQGNITQFTPCQQLLDSRPMQTCEDAANIYTAGLRQDVDFVKNQSSIKVFTSDYALYWFDYKAGYDTVLAQLGPSNNPKQEIALVRGAASMQNKSWGTILTWKNSSNPSSLMTGDEMYENLKLSYQSGAQYAVAFNYAPDVNGTGLLQDMNYAAIERFWTDIVQNPDVSNNLAIHDALVLPADYGWGMRSVNDTVWGLFSADDKAPQIWSATQNLLNGKDGKVDIIYEDSASQAASRYSGVHYWNSTG